MPVPLSAIVLSAILMANGSSEEPTLLPTPSGAIDVKQMQLVDVHAYQTYFTMKVRFPGNLALDHYSKIITHPWVRCDWSPEWKSFLDGTAKPTRTVHQQMYMWVNRPARRTLLLANRYFSSENCKGDPENDDQQVVLVEYMDRDVESAIEAFKLKCLPDKKRPNEIPPGRRPKALQ